MIMDANSRPVSCLRCLPSRPDATDAAIRLICFPYAGGSASIFRHWPTLLSDEIQLSAAQYRGRGARTSEQGFRSITDIVDEVFCELAQQRDDRPFALYGHSMGAMVAYDLARQLCNGSTLSPSHLFISGLAAPRHRQRGEPLHLLRDDAFIHALRELGGTPPDVLKNADLLGLLLPAIRADLEAAYNWCAHDHGSLSIPLTVFGGREDQGIPVAQLADWMSCTDARTEVHVQPGGHFFLHDAYPQIISIIRANLLGNKGLASAREKVGGTSEGAHDEQVRSLAAASNQPRPTRG